MMKLAWSMISHPDKLWVKIMKAKYSCGIYTIPTFCHNSRSSTTWRAIAKAWDEVKPNLIWVVHNGHHTKFGKDCWIPGVGALSDIMEASIPQSESNFPVSHYVQNGRWNWNLFDRLVPASICEKIAYLKPPKSSTADSLCWNLTSDGEFSLKSAYDLLLRSHPHQSHF